MKNKVISRFAPSPTGYLHVGGARTALFNYLFTKQHGGLTLLRIEDTDKQRSTKEYEKNILDGLAWLGLPFDGTPVRQSERTAIYATHIQRMLQNGTAYISKEEPKEAGERSEVIRFKNPGKKVTFHDLIRGEITFDTAELKDFVIAKGPEEPLYHLAVVIDDMDMNITHVIRGEDHISNTPRQILLQEALGAPRPEYAHLPLMLATDKSKLSKRKHGASVSLPYYQERGYLPEAMINFLALIGWNPGTDTELFSLDELVGLFDISKVQKSGAIYNIDKLNWLNREYVRHIPHATLDAALATAFPELSEETRRRVLPIILDRITTLGDMTTLHDDGELSYLYETPAPTREKIKTTEHLNTVINMITIIRDDDFTAEKIKQAVWDFATEQGRANVLWPMRYALTGKDKSADPFNVAAILGKEETISRLRHALTL